jgi:hypothetical protein
VTSPTKWYHTGNEELDTTHKPSHCPDCTPFEWDGTPKDKPDFAKVFAKIFDEAFQVLISRQRKYGPGNIEQQGMYGVITRITDDKAQRLKRAMNGTIVNGRVDIDIAEGESDDTFEDALLDTINYAAICIALKRGLWGDVITDDDPPVKLALA